MFSPLSINPPPLIFSGLQIGEGRVKTANFANLLADGDTALATPAAAITRRDGTTMGASDLQVLGGPALDATKTMIIVNVGNGQLAPADYWITFSAVGATSSLHYVRSVLISVVPALG